MDQHITKVGIGVMVIRGGRVLVGKRKGSHGEGEYSFPGGHLEYGESFAECARREIKEETGIEIENIRFLALTNLKRYMPKHYADIGLIADWKSGEPEVLEPNKIESWEWMAIDDIPRPVFGAMENYIKAFKSGENYFDS
jgi:8-oxo-dGTP diphosphatase